MIYFMQPVGGGPIKIGYTGSVPVRHKQLEKRYRLRLKILKTMDGDLATERELHDKFDHLRLRGHGRQGRRIEQFRPESDLLEFIGLNTEGLTIQDAITPYYPAGFNTENPDRPTKIDAIIVGWAQMVAKSKGISVGSYLSETLRATVAKDFATMMEKMREGGQ